MNDALMKLDERVRELEALVFSHLTLEKRYKEPIRPREGMIAYADGTHWNPGCGKGLYHFRDGHWYRLMVDCVPVPEVPEWVDLLHSVSWELSSCGSWSWDNGTLYSPTGGGSALTWYGFQEPEWDAIKIDYVYDQPISFDYGASLDVLVGQTLWYGDPLDWESYMTFSSGTQQVSVITYRSAVDWPTAANTGGLWGNLTAFLYPPATNEAVRITGIWVRYK